MTDETGQDKTVADQLTRLIDGRGELHLNGALTDRLLRWLRLMDKENAMMAEHIKELETLLAPLLRATEDERLPRE